MTNQIEEAMTRYPDVVEGIENDERGSLSFLVHVVRIARLQDSENASTTDNAEIADELRDKIETTL